MTGRLETFEPFDKGRVNVYVCGPTVYDYCHIGHARTYVSFDVIVRYLEYKGYKVTYVVNITNIDDKIIARARQTKEDPLAISKRFEQAFFEDMKPFRLRPANFYPRVSDHIQEVVAMIEALVRKGVAYAADGDVYFDVTKIEGFGKLSHQSLEQMMAGARVEIDRKKRSPYDFVLWKSSDDDEPGWESPWGRGRPGWHMECSAMSMKYLGPQLDIHGGARDLIFPHHENEIVQSESYTGKEPFVKYWIHTGFLTINGQKMSKSLGNFITVRDLLKKHGAESFRLFVLSTHYRRPVDFSEDGLIQSAAVLERMYETRNRLSSLIKSSEHQGASSDEAKRLLEEISEAKEKFLMGMDNDFNSAIALASFHELIRLGNRIADIRPSRELAETALRTINELGSIFGLFQEEKEEANVSDIARALIAERDQARKQRNWNRADEIRGQLKKMGIALQDSPKGTVPILEN